MLRSLARTSVLVLGLGPVSSLVSSPIPPQAVEQAVSLYCARGTADYPDAELTLSARGPHILQVVYVGYRPSRSRAEWTLRDCLRTARKLDDSRPIVASLWVREPRRGSPHELILRTTASPL